MRTHLLLACFIGLVACEAEPTPPARPDTIEAPSSATAQSTGAPNAERAKPSLVPSAQSSAGAESSASAAASASAKPDAAGASLVWAVDGAKGPTYLLGTMHLGTDAEKQLDAAVWDDLDHAEAVAMEADLAAVSPMDLMKSAMLPPDEALDELLGPERWKKLVALVGAAMPEAGLKRFKPWFAMILITQNLLPSTPPMDLVIQERAKKAGKRMHYYETMKEQTDLFDQVMTLALVRDAIDEIDKQKTLILDMQQAYAAGDAARLEKSVFDPDEIKRHPEFYRATFDQRNKKWLPSVEKQVKEGNAFIAVGAGHLLGSAGLVALLGDHGIKVRRVTPP